MTKRLARLAVVAAAVSAFALPAAPASACSWTFVEDCVNELLPAPPSASNDGHYCVWEEPTIGFFLCV